MKIQMVDLKSQYELLKDEINEAIQEVINTSTFINGPAVKEFREALKSYTGARHAVTCGNGTDALQIAMMALDFKPGDEVIVPAFSYVATVEVIALLGLRPVFVDVTADTYEIDVEQLALKLTNKTVAIVTVHLYGQCSNMDKLMDFAKANNVKVIEDSAQAIGATYTFQDGSHAQAGTIGDIGTTSFFPSKNLGCYGDGGAIFTQNDDLGEKLWMIANHGQKKKYHHDTIGVNSRLDTLQAAILNVKIKYLDRYTASRNQVAEYYDEAFGKMENLKTPKRIAASTHCFHQYTVQVENGRRDELKSFLEEKGIPTMVYYPMPLHLQHAYLQFGYKIGDFPVAEDLCKKVLSLPIHTEMKIQDQKYIIENVLTFFK